MFKTLLGIVKKRLSSVNAIYQNLMTKYQNVQIPIPTIVILLTCLHAAFIFVTSSMHWIIVWITWYINHLLFGLVMTIVIYFYPQLTVPPEPIESVVRVDDITRMNSTIVDRVFMIRTEEDIKTALQLEIQNGKHVSMRGQKHTMGGHTIAPEGYVLDIIFFKNVRWQKMGETIITQPGATWVGGTLSVNAHGITTDDPVITSVVSLRIVTDIDLSLKHRNLVSFYYKASIRCK